MGSGLSMRSRVEVTTKYARAYAKSSKKQKGHILDAVVEVTGWSRDNARRRLTAAANSPPGRQVEAEPGFFEGDTVAHCGPTLKGEFARTVNRTDVHVGWVFARTVRNNAHAHIVGALTAAVTEIPFEVTGLDFDNGTVFLNKAVIT